MGYWTNLNKLATEICQRETSEGRELNISEVKRVIRHLCDIIADEWRLNFGLTLSATLRKNGLKRHNRKQS